MADKPATEESKPPAAITDPYTAGRWYVVQSKPRLELLATQRLNAEGFPVFWPHYLGTISHAGTRRIGVMRPVYPRYLFVAVDDRHALYTVEKTAGVSAVVYLGAEALTIPARVIADQMARTDDSGRLKREVAESLGLVPPTNHTHRFKVDDNVKIVSGPFAGLLAVVERLDSNDSLRVCVEAFGRRTPVDLVEGQLQALPAEA